MLGVKGTSRDILKKSGRVLQMKKKVFLSILLCWSLAGCAPLVFFGAGGAAGIGAYKYYQGALTVIYLAPYVKTWDASLRVLEALQYKIEAKKHDLTSGDIDASDVHGRPVKVSLKYKSSQETEVQIRVGLLGDKDASIIVKEEIRKELFK